MDLNAEMNSQTWNVQSLTFDQHLLHTHSQENFSGKN